MCVVAHSFASRRTTTYADKEYVTAYPSISTTDSLYLSLRPLFIVLLVLFVALPLILALILYRLKTTALLKGSARLRLVFGSMTECYSKSLYFWECTVLVRRLVVSVVAILAYSGDNAAKFTFITFCNVVVCYVLFALSFLPHSSIVFVAGFLN